MAILTPGKKGSRFPSFRGRVVISARHGKIYARKWPRKRGPAKTDRAKDNQERFRQSMLLAKYTDARQQALSRCTMNHLPVRPYDALLAAMAGRLWAVETDDGRTLYSMSSRQDVSLNLDILNQEPGRFLIRGPIVWEPFEWGEVDQYIASQGPEVRPIWKDLPAGGGGGAGVLRFGAPTAMSTSETRFYGVGAEQISENRVEFIAPRDMTAKNLAVRLNRTPSAGGTITVTFRLNGADTVLTVTLTDADRQKLDTVNTVALVQGDVFALKAVTAVSGTTFVSTALELV